jgi:aryl-alcohol dehydrogenase-like predicted oxidoreductase
LGLYDAFREAGGNFIDTANISANGTSESFFSEFMEGHRPVPIFAIIGARKLSLLLDNLASFDLALSADQLKTLDDASRIELGFPHDFMRKRCSWEIRL